MTEYEIELLESIQCSLKEIVTEMKIANKMKSKEMEILSSRESRPATDTNQNVPRKEPEGNTSTFVDSFTYNHGWEAK